jgi:GT2 family glycosyltransferase
MPMLVSVVVPTYNRLSSLKRLLEGIARQTYTRDQFEVIVVDDGSSDGTQDWLLSHQPTYSLRLILQSHAGAAAARNRGVAAASGELILFLDDDVLPAPDLIDAHVATHRSEAHAIVIGPMSPPVDWPRPIWVRWEEDKLQRQYRAMLDGQWPCTARQFYTGNASMARQRFLAAGGFDTSFKRAEDVELGYRLRDRGARFIFNHRADVRHYAWRTFESWCNTPYQYGRYDVTMQRDKGQPTLDWASSEFHSRHALNRLLLKICAGRRPLVICAVLALGTLARVAGAAGALRPGAHALSAIFSLLYWQGVCDELGGRAAMWTTIAANAPAIA